MAQASTRPTDFNHALADAKRQAGGVADAFADAAKDVSGQARDSAADVLDTANTAARKTVGSFERAIRNTIETSALYGRRDCVGYWLAVGPNASAALSSGRRRKSDGVVGPVAGNRGRTFVVLASCRSPLSPPVGNCPSLAAGADSFVH